MEVLTAIISIIGIILTASVAIYSIRKNVEANRVSMIHTEMFQCLIETFPILFEVINLLYLTV